MKCKKIGCLNSNREGSDFCERCYGVRALYTRLVVEAQEKITEKKTECRTRNCKTADCFKAALQNSRLCERCNRVRSYADQVAKGVRADETPDPNPEAAGRAWQESDYKKPTHYQKYCYTRALTPDEIINGEISIKMDPYRICDIYGMKGGPREQVTKKGLRWTDKGQSERQVIKEIMQACERKIEMLDEDDAND